MDEVPKMIAVNSLIQDVFEDLNMTGIGEATEGGEAKAACKQLNRLIADLNKEDFISMTQHWVDVNPANTVVFKKLLEGETAEDNVVDMVPPEKVAGMARLVGNRFLPLHPCDIMQIAQRSPVQIPTSWYYGRDYESVPGGLGEEMREVGTIRLDGWSRSKLRVWYNSQLPKYTLDDTIYLRDSYNNLLYTGLKLRLANFFELSESKKAEAYSDHRAAKFLIKRDNITQRMMQCAPVGGSYQDAYNNGMAGNGW